MLPADADGPALLGQEAPPLAISRWLVAPEGETLAELRGRVVLLLPPGVVDLDDRKSIHHWSDLRAGHYRKGLRVLSLVEEAPGTLPRDVEFSVAVGACAPYAGDKNLGDKNPGDKNPGDRDLLAFLIGADGKVAWAGTPRAVSDATIVSLLRKAKTFPLRRLDPALKDAAAAFKKGRLSEARTLAAGIQHADATWLGRRIELFAAYWKRRIERGYAVSNVSEVDFFMGMLQKHLPDTPEAGTATQARAENKKSWAKELRAAKTYVRLRSDLAKTKGKPKKIDALVKKAVRFAERYPTTVGGKRATRLVATIQADPAISEIRTFIVKQKIRTKGGRWRTSLPMPPLVAFAKGRSYFWLLETNFGPIRLRFFPDVAPLHVSNMIYLTELGFFDGLGFHRVIPGFMAQGGCPLGSGSGTPGYGFDGEFDAKVRHDRPGILSAAHSGPGTDGSQFFITFGPASHLDGKHTVYGEVVKGLDTLKKIEKVGTSGGTPQKKISIEKATIQLE